MYSDDDDDDNEVILTKASGLIQLATLSFTYRGGLVRSRDSHVHFL
jgi:hypothetical protein